MVNRDVIQIRGGLNRVTITWTAGRKQPQRAVTAANEDHTLYTFLGNLAALMTTPAA